MKRTLQHILSFLYSWITKDWKEKHFCFVTQKISKRRQNLELNNKAWTSIFFFTFVYLLWSQMGKKKIKTKHKRIKEIEPRTMNCREVTLLKLITLFWNETKQRMKKKVCESQGLDLPRGCISSTQPLCLVWLIVVMSHGQKIRLVSKSETLIMVQPPNSSSKLRKQHDHILLFKSWNRKILLYMSFKEEESKI